MEGMRGEDVRVGCEHMKVGGVSVRVLVDIG